MSTLMNKMSVLFWLRKKETFDTYGYKYIVMRVTYGGERWEHSLQIKIKPKDWDSENFCIRPGLDYLDLDRAKLEATKRKIEQIQIDFATNDVPITMSRIKFLFNGGDISYFIHGRKNPSLAIICQEFYAKNCHLVSEATLEKHRVYQKRLFEFVKHLHMQDDISIELVKLKFLDELYMYCRTKLKYGFNSTQKFISYIKAIVDYAVLHEFIPSNTIRSYKCAKYGAKKEVLFLNEEQLQKLYDFKFNNDRLNNVKELFLFQCFTGLAYVDLYTLEEKNIKFDNGQYWIIKERQKSGVTSNIPLVPESLALLNKLSFKELGQRKKTEGNFIKCLSNQKYNKYLKEVGKIIGLNFELTTHVARKTFATITLNKGNISIETVAKMLGHANTKVTQSTYSRVLNTRIEKEMSNFSFINQPLLIKAQ